jgi:hypothetical protein
LKKHVILIADCSINVTDVDVSEWRVGAIHQWQWSMGTKSQEQERRKKKKKA